MATSNAEGNTLPDVTEEGQDISNQENVSSRSQPSRQSTSKQQVRHRASVACASCRDRRIRCVVPKGETECTQCKRAGTDCVIKNDDERRRPISKAYMSSLSDRISMLEGMLMEKGVVPPPPAHPPKTKQDAQTKQPQPGDQQQNQQLAESHYSQTVYQNSPSREVPSPPDSGNEDFAMHDMHDFQESDQADSVLAQSQTFQPLMKETSPFRNLDPKKEDIVYRLLSTKGNLSFDQLSGRLRFFGPTANSHVYAESQDTVDSREPPEQIRRSERIIRSLTVATHDYLMNNFWEYYNSVLHVIDQSAFEADRESQNPKFYSSFLHITILAMGYRFADHDREDMKKITLGNRECNLHREAKYMLDIELERPGGISSVQALLILGDLECGVGRDNTGWMYAGMSNRLAFDIGLHLDCRDDHISQQEIEIRQMVMRACVVFDKYWALFLGRPTSIKNQDIGVDLLLSKRLSGLAAFPQDPAQPELRDPGKLTNSEIYEYLIELMELAGKIVETRDNNRITNSADHANVFAMSESEDNAYMHVISLDRQLQNWYRRLPEHLTWKPANIKAAPYSFFHLHQQYHVTMILLHRPWAKYGAISGDGSSTNSHPSPDSTADHRRGSTGQIPMTGHALGLGDPHSIVDDSRTSLSRSICTQQAIRVARIFWQHRQRYDGKKIFVTGIQHAGTAAIALIAALAYASSDIDRRSYLSYLEILSGALHDMSHAYQPAQRMDDLLRAVLDQMRPDNHGPASVVFQNGAPVSVFGGSAGSSMMSGSAWQGSPGNNIYSILPLRRENEDTSDHVQAFKKRRPAQSRRASEFTRPPPPFFLTQTGPTPPNSSQSQSNSYSAVFGRQSGATPGMFSADHSNNFGLDFLNGPAVDLDGSDDRHEGLNRHTEDYVLVAPSNDGWGLNGMGHDHSHPGSGFEVPMADWMTGPAGLSASGVLKGAGPGAISAPSDAMAAMAKASAGGDGSAVENAGSGEAKQEGSGNENAGINGTSNGGMEWMGSEGGLNAMSPVSLSGLVQSVEKAAGVTETGVPNGPGRNHELDFFSF